MRELVELAETIADAELAPRAADFEARGEYPHAVLKILAGAGLLGLPYPQEFGGGGVSTEVYLQVLEALAGRWLAVAQSVHIHGLSCYPLAAHGGDRLKAELLPAMLDGTRLGANCVSESEAGSDAVAMTTSAARDGESYTVRGTKAWVSHAGIADYYNVFCRTGGPGAMGLSCLLVDAGTPGVTPGAHERKMALNTVPTAQVVFDGAEVPQDRLLGRPGRGFRVAMGMMDLGRLGVAALAVGLAQAALDYAVAYARERRQFGQPIIGFQGVGFLLADMATAVAAARALLHSAARLKDSGRPCAAEAAKAKLFATDTAMRVTTDAVQVLGGAGYVADHPVERWMREAKLLQIIEGTNQIQRVVIADSLSGGR